MSKWNSILDNYFSGNKKTESLILSVTTIGGAITAVIKLREENKTVFYIASGIALSSIIFFLISSFIKSKKRKTIGNVSTGNTGATFIRGLLPFEENQELLGRQKEASYLQVILENPSFKFGYISGEAGSGKTSFVRAILMTSAKKKEIYLPLYIKALQKDIYTEIQELIAKEYYNDSNKPATELLKDLITEKKRKILIVIDQFEEFFINNPSGDNRRDFAEKIKSLLAITDVHVIVSLRKEFVEDLRDFSPIIKDPKNDLYSIFIHNWDIALAKGILRQIIEKEQLQFSDELENTLLLDLSNEGVIRPVEFQIVAKRLIDKGINTLGAYKSAGRAHGILAGYIQGVIEHTVTEQPLLEIACTKVLLRSLCNEMFDTKRSDGGIHKAELLVLIKESISKNESIPKATDKTVLDVIDSCINKCLESSLIVYVDENKLNLSHDYIVKAIKNATAGIQTSAGKANQLLKYYLEKVKESGLKTIPLKDYRFITKNASTNLKNSFSADKLLKSTRYKFIGLTTFSSFLAMLALCIGGYLLLDFSYYKITPVSQFTDTQFDYEFKEENFAQSYIVLKEKEQSYLWDFKRVPLESRILIPDKLTDFTVDDSASIVAGIDQHFFYLYRITDNVLKIQDSVRISQKNHHFLPTYKGNDHNKFSCLILGDSAYLVSYDLSTGKLSRHVAPRSFTDSSYLLNNNNKYPSSYHEMYSNKQIDSIGVDGTEYIYSSLLSTNDIPDQAFNYKFVPQADALYNVYDEYANTESENFPPGYVTPSIMLHYDSLLYTSFNLKKGKTETSFFINNIFKGTIGKDWQRSTNLAFGIFCLYNGDFPRIDGIENLSSSEPTKSKGMIFCFNNTPFFETKKASAFKQIGPKADSLFYLFDIDSMFLCKIKKNIPTIQRREKNLLLNTSIIDFSRDSIVIVADKSNNLLVVNLLNQKIVNPSLMKLQNPNVATYWFNDPKNVLFRYKNDYDGREILYHADIHEKGNEIFTANEIHAVCTSKSKESLRVLTDTALVEITHTLRLKFFNLELFNFKWPDLLAYDMNKLNESDY